MRRVAFASSLCSVLECKWHCLLVPRNLLVCQVSAHTMHCPIAVWCGVAVCAAGSTSRSRLAPVVAGGPGRVQRVGQRGPGGTWQRGEAEVQDAETRVSALRRGRRSQRVLGAVAVPDPLLPSVLTAASSAAPRRRRRPPRAPADVSVRACVRACVRLFVGARGVSDSLFERFWCPQPRNACARAPIDADARWCGFVCLIVAACCDEQVAGACTLV